MASEREDLIGTRAARLEGWLPEVVAVAPPYDHAEITALLGGRIVFYVLASLVRAGKLGRYDLLPV